MILREQIREIEKRNPEAIVSLKEEEYGVIWVGKAKYVFGAVTCEAWNSDSLEVICNID